MRYENLQDAAQILTTILSQPLDVTGASKPHVSLIGAILNYDPKNPIDSDLSKIMISLAKYPGSTETLIQELELLSRDLSS